MGCLVAIVLFGTMAQSGENSRLVDPFWGCGAVRNPESQGMARGWSWLKAQVGNTHPGAVMPFGWVSACAYSGNYSSGYGRWGDSSGGAPRLVDEHLRAYGFTHFHNSGVGYISRFYNYFLFTPSAEEADTVRSSRVTDETASPGYYAATLADYHASFELAARPYAMCHRYRFPSGRGRVRVDLRQAGLRPEAMGSKSKYRETVEDCEAQATAADAWKGTVRICGLDFHFAIRAKGRLGAATCRDGVIEIPFDGETAETVIGFSFEDVAEAVARAQEAASVGFDRSRAQAEESWESALGRVRATFGDESVRRRFYSALYHSLVKPVDCGTGFLDYSTMWDVYKTQLPLVLSTQPQVARRMMDDMLKVSAELGFFPITQMMTKGKGRDNGQAAALSTYTLSDAFFRGVLTKADYPRLKTAFAGQLDGTKTEGKSPTYALDLAGACQAAAFVAAACGDETFAGALRRRASVWKTVYDPQTGYLVKDAKYYEGNYRNYSFRPHIGMSERIALAGGVTKFAAMLDDFFRIGYVAEKWDPSKERVPRVGFFEGLNNESDMETPYAYVWTGRTDRMAEVLEAVRRYRFTDGEGGCPGNNDSGGTSAWYVWSCLGLYPLTGTPYYLLATPSVDRAEVDFVRGTLKVVVERESASSIYPDGFTFNGRAFREPWISVDELERGGTLVVRLADQSSGVPAPVPTWLDASADAQCLTLRPGGSVRLPDDPEGFVPMLKMDGTTLTAFGETAATAEGVRYDFIKRGVSWARGFAKLEKTSDGARVTWTFEPTRMATKVEYGATCSLDVGRFPPSSIDVAKSGEVRIRELTARYPAGCRAGCFDGRWGYPFHSCYNVSVRAPVRTDVKAGEKLILTLDFSAVGSLALAYAGPYVADESTGWVRMNHLKNIIPGSALDFSGFGLQDAPAGKYGWLRMSDNRAFFEGKPELSPRFSGVNFCSEANYPKTAEEAERRAERLRLLGYNTLRIHHHDNLFAHYENGKLVLDAENADRLDRLVDACIRRGIYLTTDLYVSRRVAWKDIGVDRKGNVPVKTWQLVTERGWQDWCDYARLFMGHRNPYTGRTYAEEPAMPFVAIQNETAFSDFTLFPEQKTLWGEFLRAARAKTPGAFPGFSPDKLPSDGLWWDAHAETAVKSAFWAFLERRFIGRATKFLREELGVKAFLTGDNYGPTPAFVQEMRADTYGYSDAHLYETGWWEWLGKGAGYSRPMKMKHLNPLHRKSMPPESYAFNRVWGQPSCITEWDYIGPDSHRSPGGLIFGTVAAIQGWNAIWRFAYEHGERHFADNQGAPELYNLSRDPLKLASDRVTTLLYLRRDIPEAKESLALDFGEKALDPTKPFTYLSSPNWVRSGVVFSHRVGVSVRGRNVPPGACVFAQDEVNGLQEAPLEVKMPEAVAIDRIRGTFAVNTPRTIGVYTPENGAFSIGGHDVHTSGEATLFASALDGKDLVSSSRILITHLTDALGKGATYMDDSAHVLLCEGVAETDANGETISPIVLRQGTVELALPLEKPEAFVAYALESDGRRAAKVPTAVHDGKLVLNLSVKQPFGGCMLYELVRRTE